MGRCNMGTLRKEALEIFLETANKAIKDFGENKTFFEYMECPENEFYELQQDFSELTILKAVVSIEKNEWDQSEFIMSMENGKNNYVRKIRHKFNTLLNTLESLKIERSQQSRFETGSLAYYDDEIKRIESLLETINSEV